MSALKIDSITLCALAIALASFTAQSGLCGLMNNKPEIEHFYFHIRPRLGHFPSHPDWLKMYREYFYHVIAKTDKALENVSVNDFRTNRPSGEQCMDFLQSFKVRGNAISKPHEIVALDACLGWVFEERVEKQEDLARLGQYARDQAGEMAKDPELKKIFENTAFKTGAIPDEFRKKLYDFIMNLMEIFANDPRNGCHSLWLQSYNDFMEDVYLADCDDDKNCEFFSGLVSAKDSYLKIMIDSIKTSAKKCYDVLQKQMTDLMDAAYKEDSIGSKIGRRFKLGSHDSPATLQSEKNRWAREMIRILQLISGTNPESYVNLGTVVKNLKDIKEADEEILDKFKDSVSDFALQNLDQSKTENDPDGVARFGLAMAKLCKPYIDPAMFLSKTGGSNFKDDTEDAGRKSFEFYHMIYSLIRITNHKVIYGISKEKFEKDILKNKWEPLYLATFGCQVISTTRGLLGRDYNEAKYEVYMHNDYQVSIEDWPIDTMREELVKREPEVEPEEAPKIAPPSPGREQRKPEHKSGGIMSGLKFTIARKHSKQESKDFEAPTMQLNPSSLPLMSASNPERTPPSPTRAPPSQPPPTAKPQYQAPASSGPKDISWDSIEMFYNLKGRLPALNEETRKKFAFGIDELLKKPPQMPKKPTPKPQNIAPASFSAAAMSPPNMFPPGSPHPSYQNGPSGYMPSDSPWNKPEVVSSFDSRKPPSSPYGSQPNSAYNPAPSSPYGVPSSPYNPAPSSPYHMAPSAPYNAAPSSPYHMASSAPYNAAPSSPYQMAPSSPFQAAQSSPFQAAQSSPFQAAQSSPFQAAQSSPYHGAPQSPFHVAQPANTNMLSF